MDRQKEILSRLATLSPLRCELMDESHRHAGHAGARSGGGHFELHIVSAAFAGKPTLARHRLIYASLGELMHTHIHALSIRAQTPEEATQA
jgi:BolA protein